MNPLYLSVAVLVCYANDNDAFIPERWAQEGLSLLEENMVMANLVHRDFQNEVADFGDVVNTRRPGEFQIRRKTDTTTLSYQDASATNVRVPLDQWFYNSFVIKDGERSKSFKDLVAVYLLPAMQSIARGCDRAVLGRIHAYGTTPATRAGRLRNMDATNSGDYVHEARQHLNENKVDMAGRRLVLNPSSETALLKNSQFVSAEKRGDGGNALTNATLGRILGFDTYLAQNVPGITTGGDTIDGSVTNALAAGGSGSQTVVVSAYEVVDGSFAVVDGNDQPTYTTAHTFSTNTTAITLNEANKYATLASAVVKVYKSCAVNGAYAAGYSEAIVVDGWTALKAPQVGQLIAFGVGGARKTYTVIESWLSASGEQSLILDRPLEVALINDQAAFPGPYGAFNWAFHRDAVALVTRPLAAPIQGSGVMSAVAEHGGVGMRVCMQYDIDVGGTKVNLDILGGVAVLDSRMCVPLLG